MPLDPLVTTSQLTSYLAGDPALYVQMASGLIRSECHWHIFPSLTESVVYDGTGSRYLRLRSLKVTNIANLEVDDEAWDVADYAWSADGWLEARGRFNDFARWGRHCFPRKARNVTFSLTHGFAEIPDGLMPIALGIASRAKQMPASWIRRMRAGIYEYDFGSGGGPMQYGGFILTPEERSRLAPWRLQVVS